MRAGTTLEGRWEGRFTVLTFGAIPEAYAAATISNPSVFGPRQRVGYAMSPEHIEEFRQLLNDEKKRLLHKAANTIKHEIELSKDDMADEADLASALTDQSLSLRLRGRERYLIDKIDLAIERINQGEFGECVVCGDDISIQRLRARPVTTMCIACKEEQERREKLYSE